MLYDSLQTKVIAHLSVPLNRVQFSLWTIFDQFALNKTLSLCRRDPVSYELSSKRTVTNLSIVSALGVCLVCQCVYVLVVILCVVFVVFFLKCVGFTMC